MKPFNESVETFLSLIKYFLIFIFLNNLIWAVLFITHTSSIDTDAVIEGQKTRDMLAQNKIEALQGKVAQLELANQLAGVVRYPNGWTYDAGRSPFCGGGNNNYN